MAAAARLPPPLPNKLKPPALPPCARVPSKHASSSAGAFTQGWYFLKAAVPSVPAVFTRMSLLQVGRGHSVLPRCSTSPHLERLQEHMSKMMALAGVEAAWQRPNHPINAENDYYRLLYRTCASCFPCCECPPAVP